MSDALVIGGNGAVRNRGLRTSTVIQATADAIARIVAADGAVNNPDDATFGEYRAAIAGRCITRQRAVQNRQIAEVRNAASACCLTTANRQIREGQAHARIHLKDTAHAVATDRQTLGGWAIDCQILFDHQLAGRQGDDVGTAARNIEINGAAVAHVGDRLP